MRMYDIIAKKAAKKELSKQEIEFFVFGYTDGTIPDYQASALLMAMFISGLSDEETAILTDCMARSGDMLDLSMLSNTVDKHSTGGVGDKTTLIVAPIVAACGGTVAKMSGRGLGHTGGTIDKLESIKGYDTALSGEAFLSLVSKTGIAVVGQTGNLAPADKKIYALRDVTATIASLPLIASSIMSKKLAAGTKNIVLDVKTGSGAFMKNLEDSVALAQKMVEIGKQNGRNTAAVITDMNRPLGNAIGNALEVAEAVEVLKGKQGDLYEVSLTLAALMLSLVHGCSEQQAREMAKEAVVSGKAFDKMCEWIASQGGDISVIKDTNLLPKAQYSLDLYCESGYICSMDAEKIGVAAMLLGAGRRQKEDDIDYSAGIILHKKTGDFVKEGEAVCTLYCNDKKLFSDAKSTFLSAISIGDEKRDYPLVYEIIR